MLRDITIGQHFPGNSVVHRCDPRLKIIATIAYIIVLFMASNPLGIALSLALLALLYKVAQIPIKLIVKSLKPIVPIVLFTAVLNLFFITGEGEPLVHFGFIHIYREGVSYAVLMGGKPGLHGAFLPVANEIGCQRDAFPDRRPARDSQNDF